CGLQDRGAPGYCCHPAPAPHPLERRDDLAHQASTESIARSHPTPAQRSPKARGQRGTLYRKASGPPRVPGVYPARSAGSSPLDTLGRFTTSAQHVASKTAARLGIAVTQPLHLPHHRQQPPDVSSSDGPEGNIPTTLTALCSNVQQQLKDAHRGLAGLDASNQTMIQALQQFDVDAFLREQGVSLSTAKLAREAVLLGLQGSRQPLPFRDALEEEFGEDLASVECYFGEQAERACTMMAAEAFAVGHIIVFGTRSPSRALVAHEVVHVIQQGGHRPEGRLTLTPAALAVSQPGDAAEIEADAISGGDTAAITEAPLGVSRYAMSGNSTTAASIAGGGLPPGSLSETQQHAEQGRAIQGAQEGTLQQLNAQTASPITDVGAAFGGGSFGMVQPAGFQASLMPTLDGYVDQVMATVHTLADSAMQTLEHLLELVTGILTTIGDLSGLLRVVAQGLRIVAQLLQALAASLLSNPITAGGAAALQMLADACNQAADILEQLSQGVVSLEGPMQAIMGGVSGSQGGVGALSQTTGILGQFADVFDWQTGATAQTRQQSSANIMSDVASTGQFVSAVEGGSTTGFSNLFQAGGLPSMSGGLGTGT
ncbi:MAG: DUF4157 domain-containing protein, partial [Myxococcota bacterium]